MARSDVVSGVLSSAYGFSDAALAHELCMDEMFSAMSLGCNNSACSLTRHLLRLRQLVYAQSLVAILRTTLTKCAGDISQGGSI